MNNNKDLNHWGVLGMHWGVRRGESSGGSASKDSADHVKAATLRKKKLNEMSNDEIRALTTRIQLEKQYKDLTAKQLSRGEKLVQGVLKEQFGTMGKQIVGSIIKTGIKAGLRYVMNKVKQKNTSYQAAKDIVDGVFLESGN